MKLFSSEQIRQIDEATIQNVPIASIDLVERAAIACFEWIEERYDDDVIFHVFCGMGNNGADGLALSRLLLKAGYDVSVHPIAHRSSGNPNFDRNIERLNEIGADIDYISDIKDLPQPQDMAVAIDAILGTGIDRGLRGILKDAVKGIMESYDHIISIDVPTGLPSDLGVKFGSSACISASHTLTFQFPKLSFFTANTGGYTGDIHVLDIGLDEEKIHDIKTPYFLTTEWEASFLRPSRQPFSHKGNYGHALLVAGHKGMLGASILSSKACLRSGCGLLTTHLPSAGEQILHTAVPEAMLSLDSHEEWVTQVDLSSKITAIGMGPGLGTNKETMYALKPLLSIDIPKVIDADAINLISQANAWKDVHTNVIVTPHLGEFRRMVGNDDLSADDAINEARSWAKEHGHIIVLKGAYSAICTPEGQVHFNSSGHPGMATAGSGDVLTGIITGLLAQGLTPFNAARFGAWIHGIAGQEAAEKRGEHAMIASDIIDQLF